MTSYALQKVIREINRNRATRAEFSRTPERVLVAYDLSDAEKDALLRRDYHALYAFGVHGLHLRPFSILHQVSERDYLEAIRGSTR